MRLLRVSDGKRGHDNQSLGLSEALARRVDVEIATFARAGRSALAVWRAAARTAHADLVVGAGHATHLALLSAARAHHARSVVLMKPTLPRRLFDLCIVPEHDAVPADANTIVSLGALNRIRPAAEKIRGQCLVLLGGPSRHHGWSDDALYRQLQSIAGGYAGDRLLLVTSRRTPDTTLTRLEDISGTESVPFHSTDPDWLAQTLPAATTVWVTEDSVSMAYEAASAGARVGVLSLPSLGERSATGRAARAIDALLRAGRATRFEDWRRDGELAAPVQPLAEADRAAHAILERWPDLA